MQVEEKNGDPTTAETVPLKPVLQVHPEGMLAPLLLAGHGTTAHVEVKKGGEVIADTVSL